MSDDTKSTHKVEIVPIVLEKHPNADSLSIVNVWGFTCIVRTDDWKGVDMGAYVPPDSIVPDRLEYDFLEGHRRIRVRKFRGVISMGLLMPAPRGSNIGDDVSEIMGVTHYEPPAKGQFQPRMGPSQKPVAPPAGYHPEYNVDSARRYKEVFEDGEAVWITEKVHGCLDFDTVIQTKEYGPLKIGYVVENKIKCHVLSVCLKTQEISYKGTVGYSVHQEKMQWYDIEVESVDGSIQNMHLRVTENHYIWLPLLKCYRRVKDLISGDTVMTSNNNDV